MIRLAKTLLLGTLLAAGLLRAALPSLGVEAPPFAPGHRQGPASAPRVGGSKTFPEAPPGWGALECEQPQEMPLCPSACGGTGVLSSCQVAHLLPVGTQAGKS